MSKFVDSILEIAGTLFTMLFWGAFVYVLFSAWDSGWSLKEYFSPSDKTEKWMDIENVGVCSNRTST
jgi:hypothetical protein